MDGRDLVRSVKAVGLARPGGWRALLSAWRHRRADAAGAAAAWGGAGQGAGAGGWARSRGRAAGSSGSRAPSCGSGWRWAGRCSGGGTGRVPSRRTHCRGCAPEPDPRATLEARQGRRLAGGVRAGDGGGLAARRGRGAYARRGGAAPGSAAALVGSRSDGGPARWTVAVRGGGGRTVLRLWAVGPRGPGCGTGRTGCGTRIRARPFGPRDDPLYITMPVQLVVADAGTHLVFHDDSWDGRVVLREGEEGAGSGHDRPGTARAAHGRRSAALLGGGGDTGAGVARLDVADGSSRALPPSWALGPQHARWGFGSEREVRRIVAGLPGAWTSAVRAAPGHRPLRRAPGLHRRPAAVSRTFRGWRRSCAADGVRLVSIVDPAVKAEPGDAVYDSGVAAGSVRPGRARARGARSVSGRVSASIRTSPIRRCGAGGAVLYEERLAQGFAGMWHDMNEPVSFSAFGANDPAALGAALAGGARRGSPRGPQRVRARHGAGRVRGPAPAASP